MCIEQFAIGTCLTTLRRVPMGKQRLLKYNLHGVKGRGRSVNEGDELMTSFGGDIHYSRRALVAGGRECVQGY